MKGRVFALLLGLSVVVLSLVLGSDPAQAQGVPGPPLPGKGLTDLLANPGKWMTDMFNAALLSLGEKTTSDIVGFMSWLLGGGNVISQTPPGLSYDSEAVRRLWHTMRLVGDAGLAVVAAWGGINLIVHPMSTNQVFGGSVPRARMNASRSSVATL